MRGQCLTHFVRDRKGSVAVEAALGITFVFAVGTILVDMYDFGLTRARLEAGAGQIAQNTAVLTKLTQKGLDVLVTSALQEETRDTEVILMNVRQSGKINWMLQRGDGAAVCEIPADGRYFTGTLPVDPPENEGDDEDAADTSAMSMIVVDVCRRTSGVGATAKLVLPRVMQVENILRAASVKVELDDALTEENMLKDEAGGEES